MRSRATLLGHSIHQMLIAFPLGLLVTAVAFDLVGAFSHHGIWNTVAYYTIGAGIIGGVLAAIFGLIDWLDVPRSTRAWTVGAWHFAVNVVALALFAVSFWLRVDRIYIPGRWAILFAMAGAGVLMLGSWFGGELVDRHGVGVDEGAHLDSPHSLSGKPAGE